MEEQFSEVAALIGDAVRSKIVWALLDGRAYTATELCSYTGASKQSMSMHLNKLLAGEILTVKRQGRHRYFNFASPAIAHAIEAMANLVNDKKDGHEKKETTSAIRFCRSCYDHLAGSIGVGVTTALTKKKYIQKDGENFKVTRSGGRFFHHLGIDVPGLLTKKRAFARACLDWSERKDHLAGALGAGILEHFLREDWARKSKHSRAIVITGKGRKALVKYFGLDT